MEWWQYIIIGLGVVLACSAMIGGAMWYVKKEEQHKKNTQI